MHIKIKKLYLLTIILACCCISITAFTEQTNKKVEVFEVAEHQVFCEEIVPRKCLFVKSERSKEYKALWDQIENFKYISGYKYVLKVEVESIDNPPKDTSGFKYYLKEIVSRTKVKSNPHENLYISKWYLTTINGKKVETGKPYIVFQKEKDTFYGSTGCNSFGGMFKIDREMIKISRIRQTKRACPNMQNVEANFTKILNEKNEILVEYDRLYFKQNGVVVLEFKSNWAE